jgi:hypothetical protein
MGMKTTELKHHEETKNVQLAFARDVKALAGVMEEIGNHFCDNSKDLLVLDSRDLSSANLQSEKSPEHTCRCRCSRMTAPCSLDCLLHLKHEMEIWRSSRQFESRHKEEEE